jgi:hypothetical protein
MPVKSLRQLSLISKDNNGLEINAGDDRHGQNPTFIAVPLHKV